MSTYRLTIPTAVLCSLLTGRVMADSASIDMALEELSGEPVRDDAHRSELRATVAGQILDRNDELSYIVSQSVHVYEFTWKNWLNTWTEIHGEEMVIDATRRV